MRRVQDRLSSSAIHFVLLAWTVLALFPLVLIFINSLKTRKAIFGDPLGLPTGKALSFSGYESVMKNSDFLMFFGNSLTVTTVSLFLILLFGAMAAHAVSEYEFRGNCLLYTSPSPRDRTRSRMPSSA